MVLYKATDKGQLEMTKEEEEQVRSDWDNHKLNKNKPKPKTLEERVSDIELVISQLSKVK